jgi:hypothetical protein
MTWPYAAARLDGLRAHGKPYPFMRHTGSAPYVESIVD